MTEARNVLEKVGDLLHFANDFYRDGKCNTGGGDFGAHVVCSQMTEEFLNSPSKGK